MLAGSLVVSHVTSHLATWLTLLFLLSIHLWTNCKAVRAVCMRTLNRQRANIVFSSCLQSLNDGEYYTAGRKLELKKGPQVEQGHTKFDLPSPKEVSLNERIFELDGVLRWHGKTVMGHCVLGVPLQDILNALPLSIRNPMTGSYSSIGSEGKDKNFFEKVDAGTGIEAVLEVFKDEDYILSYSIDKSLSSTAQSPRFLIVLKETSGVKTQFKSWFHAFLCARRLYTVPELSKKPILGVLKETHGDVLYCWPQIEESLEEAGWDLNTGALETRSGTRVTIGPNLKR